MVNIVLLQIMKNLDVRHIKLSSLKYKVVQILILDQNPNFK